MSNTGTSQEVQKDQVLELLPEDILIDDSVNVRPFSTEFGTEQEEARIESLAATIREEGQLQPVVVRLFAGKKGGKDEYHLIAGNRRRNAIMLLNAEAKKGEELRKVRCVLVPSVGASDQTALRDAVIENIHRQDMSPMDTALTIQNVRKLNKWTKRSGTKRVAQFFRKSEAWVTQHEKLHALDDDIKARIHEGRLSADAAFKLAEVAPGKREEVAAKAQKIERAKKAKGGRKAKGGESAVSAASVAKAARTTPGAVQGPQRLPRSEILEFFDSENGPGNRGSVQNFCAALRKWADGEIKEPTLKKYWNRMIERSADDSVVVSVESKKEKKARETAAKKKGKKVAKKAAKKKPTHKKAAKKKTSRKVTKKVTKKKTGK